MIDMIKLNKDEIRDKVYACWIGKNIGGTMGTPTEGAREINNVTGFTSPKGEPLPNDDLDLQLVWLMAMEDVGPQKLNSHILGEYWLKCITPEWNEYGICKANLRRGILPPMSGEVFNEKWRNSNGAWIRSEIWACLAPGLPDTAIKFAVEDAMVDHGMGEGTYAAVFTAAIESAAFIEHDIRRLIEIGLAKLPPECRTAKTIKLVCECYDSGMDWVDTRNKVVDYNSDMGWFQAPANIGFVILGLLYGEGDFKKSVLRAINCGDDTDCTAATVGALLGIVGGTKNIPEDWKEYIGDKIITISIGLASTSGTPCPKTCTELTDRVINMIPVVINSQRREYLHVSGIYPMREKRIMEYTDGETDYGDEFANLAIDSPQNGLKLCNRNGYSYDFDLHYADVRVSYPDKPFIKPNETITVELEFTGKMVQTSNLSFNYYPPKGFTCDGPKGRMIYRLPHDGQPCKIQFTVTAGEEVEFINKGIVEVVSDNHCICGYLPIIFIG